MLFSISIEIPHMHKNRLDKSRHMQPEKKA